MHMKYKIIKKWFLSENVAVILLIIAIFLLIGLASCYQCLICKHEENLLGLVANIVICVISIANTILLYLTLKSQNDGNRNQKEMARKERFETTLFNLMDKYFDQLHRISFEVILLQNPPDGERVTINGSSFFNFAFEQLEYLKAFFEKDHYIGYYNTSDNDGYSYFESQKEESDYDEYLRIKYVANMYGISKQQFDIYKEILNKEEKSLLQICYQLFYNRWGRSYDHYLRIVKTIIDYIRSKENTMPDIDYMEIFKTYLSSKEQRFLNYHARVDKDFANAFQETILWEKIN